MNRYRKLDFRGRVPAWTECPFNRHCRIKRAGRCRHQGENHPVQFSCAVARILDMTGAEE